MNMIVPFKVPPLAPAYAFNNEEMFCEKKSCCKKFKKGKRCKNVPEGRKWRNQLKFLIRKYRASANISIPQNSIIILG